MSYRLKIDAKSRKVARFISQLQSKIQKEFVSSGMTQQEVAVALGVDRSVVNRRIKSSSNITARSIAEFAHVFGKDVEINFRDVDAPSGTNTTTATSNDLVFPEVGRSKSYSKVVSDISLDEAVL